MIRAVNDVPRRSRLWRLARALVVTGTVLACFGGGFWLALRLSVRQTPSVRVPLLVGRETADAEQLLRTWGLVPEIAGKRHDPKQPEGRIIAQVPAAGASTRPGRAVRLIVSLGSQRVAVPDLLGSNQNRALLALRAAGLAQGSVARAPEPGVPAGRIVGQQPRAGADASPGDRVDLLVGAGTGPVLYVMPDLVGRPAASTVAALSRHGFARVRVVGAGGLLPGPTVTAQSPAPGSPVAPQDPVTLTAGGG